MSGVIIEPFTSIESAERNFQRLNEAVVALQGGSIAIENIEGYENLATKNDLETGMDEVRAECQYSVGDVHISESEIDPKDKLGYGVWLLISKGRCLVGIDVAPEDDPGYVVDQDFQTPGQEGGEKDVTLTIDQMPKHSHKLIGSNVTGRPNYRAVLDSAGGNIANASAVLETGDDQPHNNLQPYYCVYMWRRTE